MLLDEQLCFALYAAQRAVTAAYRPLLDELGLTYPQYLVLLVLWERGETTVKDLAAALRLDYGTVSPLLKRLQAAASRSPSASPCRCWTRRSRPGWSTRRTRCARTRTRPAGTST
ncbi:MarR family transcriptional regulator [Streptomyces sp. NPDC006610]|uniref:MarR family winged helix-turn-helix transcriptional regulator n=1 Tax=Streptomyces sp. NPDC006610 TaxID=3154584 RepID=UPI0033B2324F